MRLTSAFITSTTARRSSNWRSVRLRDDILLLVVFDNWKFVELVFAKVLGMEEIDGASPF